MEKNIKFLILLLITSFILVNCKSIKHLDKENTLTLTFSGDLMAHDVNFNMSDYHKIYADIKDILLYDDLTFTNIEMPVCNQLPCSSYPRFNVHSDYIQAAIDSGFDVFSLANNHTNDYGDVGIGGTKESLSTLRDEYKQKNICIYFSGLKSSDKDEIIPTIIEYKGWKIMYLAITEILNSYDSSKNKVNYIASTKKYRNFLLKQIISFRNQYKPDLFILSMHLNEPEYQLNVNERKKVWFSQLSEAGVDIICGHHPHVMQNWEIVDHNSTRINSFFMYSMGNLISGQRMNLNYTYPNHYIEYTGDAVLLQLKFRKKQNIVKKIFDIKAIPITVYHSKNGYILKRLTNSWISELPEKQKIYYTQRLHLLTQYLNLKN